MDPRIVFSLPTSEPRGATAVGVCEDQLIVATATSNDITLHCIKQAEDIVLRGHHEPVTALLFSESPMATGSALLCSVSADSVLLWSIEECLRGKGTSSCFKQLSVVWSVRYTVYHIAFSEDLHHVAICRDQEVIVCDTQTCEVDTTLVGHTAAVTCCCFSPHHQHRTIFTVSEDRTFKIWDLEDSCLLYQSAVISAAPFLCLTISRDRPVMVTGSDEVMRIYDLSEEGSYRCLLKCDISKEIDKLESKKVTSHGTTEKEAAMISSVPSWQRSHGHMTEATTTVDTVPIILLLRYYVPPTSECVGSEPSLHTASSTDHVREVLKSPPTLLAVTHTHFLLFNATTLELLDYMDLRDPLPATGSPMVAAVASATIDPNDMRRCCCLLVGMFSPLATVLSVDCSVPSSHLSASELGYVVGDVETESVISVLSSVPLVSNSPLRAELTMKEPQKKKTSHSTGARKQLGKPALGVVDKPLTFKSKVRSSGYTEAPRMKAFTPKINATKPSKKQASSTKSALSQREYPVDSDHPTELADSIQVTDRPAAINSCCFSGCGQHLTCACPDKNAYSVRMPLSSRKMHAFVGHNESVLSASWSLSSEWMVSSSKDRTARVWTVSHKDPLLCMDMTSNKPFSRDITWTQFYYLDKFILLTTGNSILLYKYHIDTSKPDDIKRYQSQTRYKLVTSLSMDSAQSITATSAINDFHSYIVLTAGSNKSVELFDMNRGISVRTHPDTHSRPVHCLQQNKGSRFTSHPSSAYDLYLTAAVTDGIKLWDMRANRCASRFASHLNQALSISATFSPCGRFIATGSEDKCAYVYDMRSSSPLHKLKGHTDTVNTVAYHPLTPMLVTGSLNGSLRIFSGK